MEEFGTVGVIGLGYIGLPTAAVLATRGVSVVGVDINPKTVETINSGSVPFVEPDLAVSLSGAVALGHLRATTEVEPADVFILAVPTPFLADRTPDLSHVKSACDAIAPVLRSGNLVILESTSPPGTTRQIAEWLAEARPDLAFPRGTGGPVDVNVAHCPERVLPGRIMIELVTNDRIIGGLTPRCAERARDLYQVFCQGDCLLTDATTAELAKLSENAFRDVNIAFANELAYVCDELGVDVWDLIALANHHPRVNILKPGPGVGGHCIAVDPWFIVASAPDRTPLIRAARVINDSRPRYLVDEVSTVAGKFKDPVIACLGLAFKANIDDLRESPALDIVEALAAARVGTLAVVEPHVDRLPAGLTDQANVELLDLSVAVEKADIICLLVDHDEFRSVNRSALRGKVVFDTRGVWSGRS